MIEQIEFGDTEIRQLGFLADEIIMKLFDPSNAEFIVFRFTGVAICWFQSNHMQNVIESVIFFDDMEHARNDEKFRSIYEHIIDKPKVIETEGLKVCFITPVTGGDTIILFQTMECEIS